MKEQQLQRKIMSFLEENGCYTVKVISANKSGVPDILACCNGRFIGIEVKMRNNKPTNLQLYNIKRIQETGGTAVVVNDKNWKEIIGDLL